MVAAISGGVVYCCASLPRRITVFSPLLLLLLYVISVRSEPRPFVDADFFLKRALILHRPPFSRPFLAVSIWRIGLPVMIIANHYKLE